MVVNELPWHLFLIWTIAIAVVSSFLSELGKLLFARFREDREASKADSQFTVRELNRRTRSVVFIYSNLRGHVETATKLEEDRENLEETLSNRLELYEDALSYSDLLYELIDEFRNRLIDTSDIEKQQDEMVREFYEWISLEAEDEERLVKVIDELLNEIELCRDKLNAEYDLSQ